MQWYEGTSKKLEVGYRYSHQDLIRLLKSDYPQMSESSYHWAVCGMLKSGNLTKVARNVYVLICFEKFHVGLQYILDNRKKI